MHSGSLVEGYTFKTKSYNSKYCKITLMLDRSFNVRSVLNSFIKSYLRILYYIYLSLEITQTLD